MQRLSYRFLAGNEGMRPASSERERVENKGTYNIPSERERRYKVPRIFPHSLLKTWCSVLFHSEHPRLTT